MVRDALADCTPIPPGDSKMLSFLAKTADVPDTNAPSKEMLAFGRHDSQSFAGSNGAVSVRGEHSQISPQMAPSWFDQYGTFKNGQILRMHDAQRTISMNTSEMPFTAGRPDDRSHAHSSIEQGNAAAAASQFGIVQKGSTCSSIASEKFSSPQSLQPDSGDVSLVVMRPKKRKIAVSKLVPWHKEVMHGPQRLQNVSVVEVDWAQATNRLTEKVEDEVEMVDDGLPVLRSKRRLILTTQLMQILLRPALASVFSADATLHYENAAYFVARSTLGDACSKLSCTGSDTPAPSNSRDLQFLVWIILWRLLPSVRGLPQMVIESINKCDVDIRRELFSSILLAGGTASMQQLKERLEKDLLEESPQAARVKVLASGNATERRFSVWIGGSILASLGSCPADVVLQVRVEQIFHTQFKRVELTGMKSMGRLMYRENALDTIFVKVAVQKVVSVFVVDNFMVGEAVFHVI
ncbi:hypothetical protein NC651_028535 [Populus alba x Populus x berolinensis]|nr:hypothetical protein NC651_028535 [Populus alba x Populus x berolinensis]